MSGRRRVTRADIQAKLRQIHESLMDLVQRVQRRIVELIHVELIHQHTYIADHTPSWPRT